jgi:hypothetical protein
VAEGEKPEILRESRFTVEEGVAYRVCRTGAIWMNKLFFSSLVLLAVWLAYGWSTGDTGCATSVGVVDSGRNITYTGPQEKCSLLLATTSKYLGAMAVLSFLLSIGLGMLGLVFGKRIVEAAPAADEVGAGGVVAGGRAAEEDEAGGAGGQGKT